MKPSGTSFRHPATFWLGSLLVLGGVLAHLPMFMMARHTHWQMVGMPMTPLMWLGMAAIPVGLVLAMLALMPGIPFAGDVRHSERDHRYFHIADGVPLNREHWALVLVLMVALAVDVMKPATLGFVMPGLRAEYAISQSRASLLALLALSGTTVGSLLWGRIGDRYGRRTAILLSALMFIGTSICGAMPSYEWNLSMCFLMGASAGGLLPIAFTLMAETIPAAHRGWLLVALGGIGTSAGYLLASGAAAILEPMFSWRVLWLLGLPTGGLLLLLNRWIPESPRFLSNVGLESAAKAVLQRYSGHSAAAVELNIEANAAESEIDEQHPIVGMRQLLRGAHAPITWGLLVCGLAWGLVNFGFLLWLPSNLAQFGLDASGSGELLARSAILALPGIAIVVWLYHRWSSIGSLVLFIALTTLSLLAFCAIGWSSLHSAAATVAATAALLVSVSGVIAMLIPYAAEIYPVQLRATGAGLIAAGSKFGGILAAALAVMGFFNDLVLSALLIAVPMALSGLLLMRSGIETRGRRLDDIQNALSGKAHRSD